VILFGLLFIASVPGMHLDRAVGIPLESAFTVVRAVADAVERRTGVAPVIDDPVWSSCDRKDRCLLEVASRLHAQELIFVRVFGGPTRLKVVSERIAVQADGSGLVSRNFDSTLAKEGSGWADALDQVAAELFPEILPPSKPDELRPAPPALRPELSARPRLLPWVLTGVAIASGAIALGFALDARAARSSLEAKVLPDQEYAPLRARVDESGPLSNGFLIGALLVSAAGAVLFLAQ
jgi:hypothetical protein